MSRTAGPDAGQPSPPYAASVATTLRAIAILAALALTIWLLSSIVLLIFMAVLFTAMLSGASD
jgi:hypothetical protein